MKTLISNLKVFVFLIFITGITYPAIVTLFAQGIFKFQANGSLMMKDGKVIGSELLAQDFKGLQYFWPRPSSVNYNSSASGASNLSPGSKTLHEQKKTRAVKNNLAQTNQSTDLLYASGSGLDPHISPEAAEGQLERIAIARNLDTEKKLALKQLVEGQIEKRDFGILGKNRVNVLKLNLLLDKSF